MKRQIPPEYLRHLRPRSASQAPGVTLRAVAVGAVISLAIGAGLPYSNMIIRGGLLAHNFNTPAAVFSFFLFVGFINVGLGLIRRSWELRRGELATVYIMALLATAIPTVGFSENLLPIIAGLRYYAAPENGWTDSFLQHLPNWLVPSDAEAIRGFYEGSPHGVPWHAWVEPLAAWCVFILAVYWVSACILVILRQQWMERERLLYPLAQVPLALLQEEDPPSRLRPFFRSGLMWCGFAVPMLIGSMHALHTYYPQLPSFDGFAAQGPMSMRFFAFGLPIIIMLNLGLVGFTYLISRDVSLGLWFFFLLATVQRGMFQMVGFRSEETLSRFANLSGPFLAHQGMGAMIVLTLSGLWVAREHLLNVLRRALSRGGADDSDEVMSFRVAVFGGLIGVVIVSVWLWLSGLPWWVVPVFLFAVFVIFTALTRAIVEGGVAVLRTPLIPADFVVSGLGASLIGTSGLVSLGLTYVWAANLRLFFMPCFANALRIAEEVGRPRRRLMWAAVIAVLLSLGASIWCVLHLAYLHGGINVHKFWFLGVPRNAGNYLHHLVSASPEASATGWLFTAIGGTVMGVLIWARATILWWPLHPLGYAVSTFHIMGYVWFSVFVAWAIKGVVLRMGGPALFRRSRPFFLGLIMGQVVVTGMWLVIDYCTGTSGNQPIGGSFV